MMKKIIYIRKNGNGAKLNDGEDECIEFQLRSDDNEDVTSTIMKRECHHSCDVFKFCTFYGSNLI